MYSYWKLLTNIYGWEVKGVFNLLFSSCVWTYLQGASVASAVSDAIQNEDNTGMVTTLHCPEDR